MPEDANRDDRKNPLWQQDRRPGEWEWLGVWCLAFCLCACHKHAGAKTNKIQTPQNLFNQAREVPGKILCSSLFMLRFFNLDFIKKVVCFDSVFIQFMLQNNECTVSHN